MMGKACAVLLLSLGADAHLPYKPGRFYSQVPAGFAQSAPASVCDTKFTLNSNTYDVSGLQVDVGGWIADNSKDKYHYCLNICKTVTSERNCICNACGGVQYPAQQVFKDPAKGETCEAYLGTLDAASWRLARDGRNGITLSYKHGQGNRSTEVTLLCDPKASEYSSPVFVGSKDSVFSFDWNNPHACPLNTTNVLV